MYIDFSKVAKTLKVFGTTLVPHWYHHFFKITYIAGNGDAFTVNIPRVVGGKVLFYYSSDKKEIKK